MLDEVQFFCPKTDLTGLKRGRNLVLQQFWGQTLHLLQKLALRGASGDQPGGA